MVEAGAREGVIEKQESDLISNLMSFKAIQARDVMTPRTVTAMVDAGMTFAEFQQLTLEPRFSRIPLHSPESGDVIVGYILLTEALQRIADGNTEDTLETIRRDIPFVTELEPIDQLFEFFLNRREHLAVVVDHYGETRGVVTLEDVIETLLGLEIVDELDSEADMQALARENWKRRARARGIPIDG
jgi:CBS domain containing-hemolysin-like protein